MSPLPPRTPPANVPILTEVVGFSAPAAAPAVPSDPGSAPDMARMLGLSEEQISQRVLTDLQRQVDLMFEYRVREVMAPALERLAQSMIQEVRSQLSDTLRDVVRRAVAQELSRQRPR